MCSYCTKKCFLHSVVAESAWSRFRPPEEDEPEAEEAVWTAPPDEDEPEPEAVLAAPPEPAKVCCFDLARGPYRGCDRERRADVRGAFERHERDHTPDDADPLLRPLNASPLMDE